MSAIQKIFWNSKEKRFRSGFRIPLALIAFLLFYKLYLFILTSIGVMLIYSSKTPLWIFILAGTVRILPAVLAIWLVGRFIDKRKIKSFGFRFNKNWWIDFGFGFGLGAILMTSIFIIELLSGWVSISGTFRTAGTGYGFLESLLVFIFVFVCAGAAEEIFARGYLIKNLSEGLLFKSIRVKTSIIIALISTSIFFGLMHLGNSNASLISTFNIMLAGLMFGIGYVYTSELAIPIGLHVSWNFFQANIYGFPVSGIKYPSEIVSVFQTESMGPEILTGGSFGPEAGLLGAPAFIMGSIIILLWVRSKRKLNINEFNALLTHY